MNIPIIDENQALANIQLQNNPFFKDYSEWLTLADLNLAAVIRSRMQAIPDAILLEQDGLLGFSIGRPILDGHLNGILRYNQNCSTESTLEFCNRFLQSSSEEFIIWIRDHADTELEKTLRNLGLTPRREPGSAGMVIEHRIVPPEIPADLEICKISTNKDATDFTHVTAAAFELPFEICQLAIGSLNQLTKPNVASFVVRKQNQAVAGGMVIVEQGIGGIYYIGTIPQARGRGLGELCTRMATNAAFDLGARGVVLQASLAGEPLYKRLGYETITHYRWYPMLTPL